MIERRAPSPPSAPRHGDPIGYVVYAVGSGLAILAWSCVVPLVRAVSWLRHRRDIRRRGLGALFVTAWENAATAPTSADRARARHGYAIRVTPAADVIEVSPDVDARHYLRLFEALQRPRAKLLDLRQATRITSSLFERLGDSWRTSPDTVPRLAILLDYERWVVFRRVAEHRLRPIVHRGVAVEIMYEQQLVGVDTWFETGEVVHDVPAVCAWLRTSGPRSPIWRTVLQTTALLVQAAAPEPRGPDLLLDLADIALSLDGPDRTDAIEQALVHTESALRWTGKEPSAMRCRALRAKAAVLRRRGDRLAAIAELNTALSVAMVIDDHIEEASTFAEIGRQALADGHVERAEARFRAAIALLSNRQDRAPSLRAALHHHLAEALHAQQIYDQAEQHAGAALALRPHPDSVLANEDRALLDEIRAHRAATVAPQRAPDTTTNDRGR